MSKGQKRSNREAKKPKQSKSGKNIAVATTPLAADREPIKVAEKRNVPRR
jgi:hypothetical protein